MSMFIKALTKNMNTSSICLCMFTLIQLPDCYVHFPEFMPQFSGSSTFLNCILALENNTSNSIHPRNETLEICCLKLEIKEIKLNLWDGECVHVQSLCYFNLADTQKCWFLNFSTLRFCRHVRLYQYFICNSFFAAVPPMVWIQNQLVGSAIGQRISLECQSEAYPKSINYWMKNETIITLGNFVI